MRSRRTTRSTTSPRPTSGDPSAAPSGAGAR
ncbi:unnamed protein product [Linum tenue]|uniref:Uncharacterized protein n=1 Tax=Linum tenue TaxID=586396 RepID=A0AAV0I8D8_9ROSI|nr:unnamed protein product [Linum tenue]